MSADLRHAENNSLIEPSTCVRKLPPDSIKIDGSFVRDLTINSGSRFIVKSVIYLSQDLPINIVAEGIETSEQINFLRLNDCHVRWIWRAAIAARRPKRFSSTIGLLLICACSLLLKRQDAF